MFAKTSIAFCLAIALSLSCNGAYARQVLAEGSNESSTPDCPLGFVSTSTGVPGVGPSFEMKGDGNVNYTCSGGVPLPYSYTFARLDDNKKDWGDSLFYYDQTEFPTISLRYRGGPERKIVLAKEVALVPSPVPGNLAWARWKVASDSGPYGDPDGVKFTYVERKETVNGKDPETCNRPLEFVWFRADYLFYTCKEATAAAIVPTPSPTPSIAPIVAAPTPAAAPSVDQLSITPAPAPSVVTAAPVATPAVAPSTAADTNPTTSSTPTDTSSGTTASTSSTPTAAPTTSRGSKLSAGLVVVVAGVVATLL